VTPKPSANEARLLYVLFPSPTTKLTLSDGTTGFCGYHHHAQFGDDADGDNLFWAIFSTKGADVSTGPIFVNGVAFCVSHEVAEALSDRDGDGYISDDNCEISDICENEATFNYRGWDVEHYWSNWKRKCIRGDEPVSVRRFLLAQGLVPSLGLLQLGTKRLSLDFMAARMRA
jgi:hypothetical protein